MTIAMYRRADASVPTSDHALIKYPDPEQPLPLWRRGVSAIFTLSIFAAAIFLWPALLGGSTRLVIVSGQSMEPTYDLGDIVVTRDRGEAGIGDTVVFAVPEGGGEGLLVIHRIIEMDENGFFITQGDNNSEPDRWLLTHDDMVGQPILHVPNGGNVVFFLRQWIVIAVLGGLLAMFLLWPATTPIDDETLESSASGRPEPEPIPNRPIPNRRIAPVDVFDIPVQWSDVEIEQAVLDEADAWLEEQLQSMLPMRVR